MQHLLITGEMRSGTTFLANFLNSQKNMLVYADMLVPLFTEAHAMGVENLHRKLNDREKNVLLSNLIQMGKIHQLDFSGIDRSLELNWLELFNEALMIIKGDEPASILGVKRTREEIFLPELLEAGVQVIYCVRDPRDVSISAKNRFAGFNLPQTIRNWQKSANMALQLKSHPNFYLLRYEDLILDKEHTAIQLGKFLKTEINTDLQQLRFGKNLRYQDNSSFGDVKKLFDANATYRWKAYPEKPEVAFCQQILSKEMIALGYQCHQGNFDKKAVNNLKKSYQSYLRKQFLKRTAKKILG